MPDRDTGHGPRTERPHQQDGPACPGCGLPNYSGFCPVCRGDYAIYQAELQFAFGPWFPEETGDA